MINRKTGRSCKIAPKCNYWWQIAPPPEGSCYRYQRKRLAADNDKNELSRPIHRLQDISCHWALRLLLRCVCCRRSKQQTAMVYPCHTRKQYCCHIRHYLCLTSSAYLLIFGALQPKNEGKLSKHFPKANSSCSSRVCWVYYRNITFCCWNALHNRSDHCISNDRAYFHLPNTLYNHQFRSARFQ